MASFDHDGNLKKLDGDEIQEMNPQLVLLQDWVGRTIERIQPIESYGYFGHRIGGCFMVVFTDGSMSEVIDVVGKDDSCSECNVEELLSMGLIDKAQILEIEESYRCALKKAKRKEKLIEKRNELILSFGKTASIASYIKKAKKIREIESKLSEIDPKFRDDS